jgi:hypothetical protein
LFDAAGSFGVSAVVECVLGIVVDDAASSSALAHRIARKSRTPDQ